MKFQFPALFLLLLVLVGGFAFFSENIIDPDAIANRVSEASIVQKAVFFAGAVLFTAIGLPRQLVAFVCGFVFGLIPGVLVSLCTAVLGCMLAFYLARKLLRKQLATRYAKTVELLDGLVRHDAFLKIIVLRIQPLGTNLLTNLCAGVSSIRPALFFPSTAIGYLPQMVVFALAGDGVRLGDQSKILISAGLMVLSFVLAYFLWQRHKQRKSNHAA